MLSISTHNAYEAAFMAIAFQDMQSNLLPAIYFFCSRLSPVFPVGMQNNTTFLSSPSL